MSIHQNAKENEMMMDRRGKGERVGQHPLPPTRVKLFSTRLDLRTYDTTYMEIIDYQFIQRRVDHVDPHTQLLLAQAQDRASIDAH